MSKTPNKRAQEWEEQIELGLKYRQKFSSEAFWSTFRENYRGKWKGKIIPINRVFSLGRSMIPRVYFRNPSIMVTATHPMYEAQARVLESVDNYIIREIKLKKAMKKGALHAYLSGTGPIKLGYDSEFGYIPEQAVDENAGTITQVGKKTGELIEYNVNVKSGMPWALPCRPEDIVTPWGYDDADGLPWICHLIFRPLEDVKNDQKYRNTANLKGGFKEKVNIKNPYADTINSNSVKYCLLKEIRDVRTRKMLVVCEDQILLEQEDPLQIEGLPYEFVIFNEDAEHFWGISDAFINAPQQKELNEIRTQASKLRKSSILKYLYKKGIFKKEDLEKFLDQDIENIGSGIEVDDDHLPTAVYPLQPKGLVADTTAESREVEGDMRETFGYGRNQMGEYSPFHGKTATEAQIVQQSAEIRNDERRDIIGDVLTNIIRKHNQFIFKFWTKEKVVKVAGPEGNQYWVQYTGDQLRGEYDYRLDPDSGLPISRGMRYQFSKELLEIFNQDPYINQKKLREVLLRQFDWMDPVTASLVQEPGAQPNSGVGSGPENPMQMDQFAGLLKQGGR